MRKLTPVDVTQDEALVKQIGVQEINKAVPLSRDPKNYPVFRVPVNKKVLIYVPNHTVQEKVDDALVDQLRMDKPYIHIAVEGNNRYGYYRCIRGLESEALGYDGECPLCDGAPDPWTLANLIIEDKCKAQGLNPEDTENEDVKAIRSKAFSSRALGDAEQFYTFPIVVFETVNDDGKTLVETEDGISYKVMWYTCSARLYEKKWAKALENMEDEPTHPGGMFLILDYTYTPKRGEPNARDSARELTIFRKQIKNSEKLRKALDEQTESWTPELASKMVIRNNFYSAEDLKAVADEVLVNTRNLIQLYENKAGASTAIGAGTSTLQIGNKVSTEEAMGMTDVGETDEDDAEDTGLDVG